MSFKMKYSRSSERSTITATRSMMILVIFLAICLPGPSESRRSWGLRSRDANVIARPISRLNQCCNVAGVVNAATACSSSTCHCKANVQGAKCDECKPGHYNLDMENTDGCSVCYCFGATDQCTGSNWPAAIIKTLDGWLVTDLPGTKVIEPETHPTEGYLVVANDELPGVNSYYWDAPQEYLGSKLYSYGGDIRFTLSYVIARGDTSGWFTQDPDVILQGGPQNLRIGYNWKLPRREEEGKTTITLPLREQGWFKVNPDGTNSKQPVSREEFTLITYNLKRLLVRAKFHTDQLEGGLHNVDMEIANNTVPTGKLAKGTEMCDCPEGYAGLSCEICAPGYRRVNNTLVNGQCVKCECNGHSPSCDPYTGRCSICLHHTTGEMCDRCEYGYYGNPKKGTPDDCKPCACPLLIASNNFSPSCYASESTPGGYICDACPKGYTGDRCERCSEGYWGSPTVPGGKCIPCDCGPDADTSIPGWCDHRTGACMKCRGTVDRECKKCPPRHILTSRGCQKCDDPCVDQLLDDVDAFGIAANQANLTGIKDLPKIRLRWVESQVNKTSYNFRRYQHLIDEGQRLLQNVSNNFDLEALADMLFLRSKQLEDQGKRQAVDAERIGIEAEDLLDQLQDILDELNRVIDSLRRYGLDVPGSGVVATDRLLFEAERILRELMNRDQQPNIDVAEREVRKAKQLLTRVKQLVTSPGTSGQLRERLELIRKLLSEFITIVQDKVQIPLQMTFKKNQETNSLYEHVVASIASAQKAAFDSKTSIDESHRLIHASKSALIDAALEFAIVSRIKEDLDNATSQVEIRRSILARLNPYYTEQYVRSCTFHVLELKKRLETTLGLFNSTRETIASPMKAATVYNKIVDALTAAELAARSAYAASDRAYLQAYPGTDDALTKQAAEAKEKSLQLLEEAKNLRITLLPALERDLGKHKFTLDTLADDLAVSHVNVDEINRVLQVLPTGFSKSLRESNTLLKSAFDNIRESSGQIESLDGRIRNELQGRLDRLNEGSASGLDNLTRILDRAREDIRAGSRYASNAEEISERVTKSMKEVYINLKELKDRILLARHAASSIKVSLGTDSKQECIRSFVPELEPSTTNTIILSYAIKDEAKDALLFFLSSETVDDFMAIEMVERKIRFLWNAGGGTQVIINNTPIETNDPAMNKDNQWYKIIVTRIGNIATLEVKRITEVDSVDKEIARGSSPPLFNRMDFDSNSSLFISGIPAGMKKPRELINRKFAGCLYEVLLDGKKIGLWNFKSNFGCHGCKEGATEPRDASVFTFRGDSSYAILKQMKRYDRRKYSLMMHFKTFDEDALLFFTGNKVSGDFLSLTLKAGKVIFQINFGSTSRLTLSSKQKYNTGQWVRVGFDRDRLEGYLFVDDEILEGKIPTSGTTSLDLATSEVFYGGVPPNFTFQHWPTVSFRPFLGCVKALQVDSSPLDLSMAHSHGLEAGCRSDVNSLTDALFYAKTSYIELNALPLREEADFTFTFKTTQNDALLLLSSFIGQNNLSRDAHYYSIALVGGLLEGRFNGGLGETTLISETRVNDGSFHTISVSRRNRRVAMSLDDTEIANSRLVKHTGVIEAPAKGGLFIGGIAPHLNVNDRVGTRESLRGVIRELVFYQERYNFSSPLRFEGVSIGRQAEPDPFSNLGHNNTFNVTRQIESIDIHLIDETMNSSTTSTSQRIDFKADAKHPFNETIIEHDVDTATNEMNVIGERKDAEPQNAHKPIDQIHVKSNTVNQVSLLDDKVKQSQSPPDDLTTENGKDFIFIENINTTDKKWNNFYLSLHLKTNRNDGFIFILPASVSKSIQNESNEMKNEKDHHEHSINYLAASMRHGQLVVEIKAGKKTTLIASGDNLADETWHIVKMNKLNDLFSLQIDSSHAMSLEIDMKTNQKLFFTPSVLIGGTFDTLYAHQVIDSIFKHKKWMTHRTTIQEIMRYKFRGCLKYFIINDVHVNMQNVTTPLSFGCG